MFDSKILSVWKCWHLGELNSNRVSNPLKAFQVSHEFQIIFLFQGARVNSVNKNVNISISKSLHALNLNKYKGDFHQAYQSECIMVYKDLVSEIELLSFGQFCITAALTISVCN